MDTFNALTDRGFDVLFMHNAGMSLSLRALSSRRLVGPFYKLVRMVPVALRAVPNSLLCPPVEVGTASEALQSV